MKRRHWIEIQLVNEMMTVGVKVTAMLATKATDIFTKTSVRNLQRHVEAQLCTGLGGVKAGVHQLVHQIECLKPCVVSGIPTPFESIVY